MSNDAPNTPKGHGGDSYEMNFHRDFEPLKSASKVILAALRADESAPGSDLYRRLASSTASVSPSSSHVYFPADQMIQKSISSSSSTTHSKSAIDSSSNSATTPSKDGYWKSTNNNTAKSSPWAQGSRPSSSGTNISANQSGQSFSSPKQRILSTNTSMKLPSPKAVHFKKAVTKAGSTTSTTNNTITPTTIFTHHHSIPLPSYLSNLISNVRLSSLMGLLPEANLAWMSVDEKLYVWSYDSIDGDGMDNGLWSPTKNGMNGRDNSREARMEDFCTFIPPSKRNIVSVGLVRPRKGVFKDSVRWCLVVTTDDEAILCAITNSSSPNEGSFGSSSLRLIPTRFNISTDSVPMVSISGTPDGRIFLGGYDGSLYEMQYEGSFTQKTSSSIPRKLIAGSKRALEQAIPTSLLPGSSPTSSSSSESYQPHKKCRKLNHSNKSLVFTSILPGFVQKLMSPGNGPIIDICVDSERGCLYTLTSRGILHYHDLTSHPVDMQVTSSVDLLKMAKLYLNAVTRGQMYPPSSSIRFPGGGSAAALGVGGMEGARSLLKAYENEKEQKKIMGVSTGGVLNPISLHVITKMESKNLSLLAITGAGVRFYLTSSGSSNGYNQNIQSGKQTYLCHIRSPPLIDDFLVKKESNIYPGGNDESNKSILPGYHSSGGRSRSTPNVMASFYRNGTMMIALDGKKVEGSGIESGRKDMMSSDYTKNSNLSNSEGIGDLILSVTPDCAARITNVVNPVFNGVTTYASQSNIGNTNQNMSVANGLSESIFLPHALMGSSPSNLLPGGRIWEIASPSSVKYCHKEKENHGPMLYEQLFWASSTPSDAELSIGLVPAIMSSKADAPERKNSHVRSRKSSSRAIVSAHGGMFTSAIALIGNIINGRRDGDAIISSNELTKKWNMANYKVAEMPMYFSYGSTFNYGEKIAFATKLPLWLVKPDICPLEEISVHHLSTSYDAPPRNVLALNGEGLHFFQRQTLLDQLASCLHQGSSPTSPAIKSFFETYGYKEGCAMALALAVCRGDTSSKLLSKRAIQAALSHANQPKLVPASPLGSASHASGSSSSQFATTLSTTSNNSSDKLLINGQQYDFHPSSLHDGLVSLTSRLLRPIWFKPAILVSPSKASNRPAKVEFLLDATTLEEVRRPLHSLQTLLRSVFSPAVSVIPWVNKNSNDMEVDEGDHNLITRALQFQNQSRLALESDGSTSHRHPSPKELEKEARLLEEKSLHSLYRLVSRTVQMLSLLNLLRRAHDLPSLPEVEWGMLHGLYFQQLVALPKAQERIQSLLSMLVSFNSSENKSFLNNSSFSNTEADKLAMALESQTYLYFSAGDRLTFQGYQAARAALTFPENSARRVELSAKAGKLLRMAAKHWESPSLVSGRIMHDQNSQRDIADNVAFSNSSPVAKAAKMLMSINNVGAIVDVCLVCASNFGGTLKGTTAENESPILKGGIQQSPSILPWEVGLYHAGGNLNNNIQNKNTGPLHAQSSQAHPTSQSAIVVSGVDVTPEDARKSCYHVALFHLGELLKSSSAQQREHGELMLSVAANSHDELFHHVLYSFLVSRNHVETLLRVQSHKLENWLIEEKKDRTLLWRYYIFHNRHIAAADLMYKSAKNDAEPITLTERIECLTRAVNSLRSATEAPSTVNHVETLENDGRENALNHLSSIEEELEISRIQQRILSTVIESNLNPPNQTELESKLLGVSDLYNLYAAPLGLYEICLSIIHSCKRNDPSTIETLWRSIISKEVSMKSESSNVQSILSRLRDGTPIADMQIIDDEDLFENGKWISNVKDIVVTTGKELYGKGADYAFPLLLLASTLEDLREAYESLPQSTFRNEFGSNPWPLHCFIEAGVGFPSILDCYIDLYDVTLRESAHPNRRLLCLSNIAEVLKYWVLVAISNTMRHTTLSLANTVPKEVISKASSDSGLQLSRALASGLKVRIDSWKGSIESLLGGDVAKTKRTLELYTEIELALDSF